MLPTISLLQVSHRYTNCDILIHILFHVTRLFFLFYFIFLKLALIFLIVSNQMGKIIPTAVNPALFEGYCISIVESIYCRYSAGECIIQCITEHKLLGIANLGALLPIITTLVEAPSDRMI